MVPALQATTQCYTSTRYELRPGGPDVASESWIIRECEPVGAEIEAYDQTNGRPSTPRDGFDERKANFHDSRTNYVWMTCPLSNLSAPIT